METLQAESRDEEELRKKVEVWFSDSMERVSGWYKRRTQALLLIWSLVVTVGLNADTLVDRKAFWNDPALRQAVVTRAEQYVSEHQPWESESGAASDAAPPPPLPPYEQAEVDFREASENLDAALADLSELRLPIGWETRDLSDDVKAGTNGRLIGDDDSDDWPGKRIWEPEVREQ